MAPLRHIDTKITRQGETTGEPNTPATARPASTTCGQPPRRHHAKRRGAIYDARRPAGRNHRRMTTRPRRPAQHPRRHAQHPRRPMRPTSCRPRAAAGVINGAPTTRRHQDNPTGRNRRRTQHARGGSPNTSRLSMRPTSCRLRAATGVINDAPTTRRHQNNPAERNHRRTQHVPLRHANAKTGCGPAVPTEKLAFPCPGSRLCVSLHQANGKMPAAVP